MTHAVMQSLFSWVGPDEQRPLCPPNADVLPVSRWFVPQWAIRPAPTRPARRASLRADD